MVSFWDVTVCRARSTVVVFSACLGVMVWGPAVCAEDSVFTAFEPHVALFSTPEACGAISIV